MQSCGSRGKGNTAKEAIMNALVEFGQKATYPKGDIIAEGPKKYFGEENRIKVHSTGENWNQEMAGDLSMISAISGVLGLVLVFTPLAPLGAGLLFVSGVTGAGAAGLRIKDRIEHETFELNAETMLDVVDIVTGFIVAGKVATTAFKVVNQASKGSRMAALVQGIETSADVASVVLIGNQFLGELERIEDDDSLSEEEKESQKSEILQQAAAAGLLMLVGYAAPKLSRKFGATRNESLQGPDPDWKSTQTGNTSKNSKILRENLGLQKGDGNEAHHIVPSTSKRADQARAILDKYQIDINAKENGVGITKGQHQESGLHKHKNIDEIYKRLEDAQEGINNWGEARKEILEELESIKSEIINGLFP